MAQIGDFVYPGETVRDLKSIKNVVVIGPGLSRKEENQRHLTVTECGKLCFKAPNTYWVEGKSRRYIPKKGDLVVGTVFKKAGDSLRIDIGSSEFASLSMFAFEGATKKQRPDVNVGDVVYAKLLNAHREMEPELICVDSYFKAGKMGILSNEGFMIDLNTEFVHRLLNIENPLLRTLGKKFVFEIAIGMNGKVWINGNKTSDVLKIVQVLKNAESHSDQNVANVCRKLG